MDVKAVLSVADEIEAAERDAVSEFVRCDGLDAVGAAYAAGGIDALAADGPSSCEPHAAPASPHARCTTGSTWRRSA